MSYDLPPQEGSGENNQPSTDKYDEGLQQLLLGTAVQEFSSRLIGSDAFYPAVESLVRGEDHSEALSDFVLLPWQSEGGKREGVVARASSTQSTVTVATMKTLEVYRRQDDGAVAVTPAFAEALLGKKVGGSDKIAAEDWQTLEAGFRECYAALGEFSRTCQEAGIDLAVDAIGTPQLKSIVERTAYPE